MPFFAELFEDLKPPNWVDIIVACQLYEGRGFPG